ncbi:class I SAM-dependent methyltransferase [Flavobacterium pectinovorum]|uniref:Class I SAM-dependent methyltransferase n=1 Tax=Flavobacterium pectinovorum TaxID=29533 RepID=A0A502EU87_9FLAO|nr:class I SAM-dependent methyltransferase [Flavobacterium pectinovorum]TPG40110.1 class I SAM-dependent methyltransferase [Flavobacterium pectinovorum]
MKNWTGERLETFIYNRIAIEHLHRYAIASDYVKDKVVLDIASGEGYGVSLMSKKASFVYGVDIDKSSIDEAKLKYKDENIEFLEGSTSAIPLEDNSVDIVVSFETIEHHGEHDEMMIEIKRVLKANGLLIISTPDKLHYSENRNLINEFHVKELYKDEFSDLVFKYFNNVQLLSQIFSNGSSIVQEDKYQKDLSFYYGNYFGIKNRVINPMFLIIITSDVDFQKQNTSIFDGGNFMKNELFEEFRTSITYRVGHFVLLPFKFLKRILK